MEIPAASTVKRSGASLWQGGLMARRATLATVLGTGRNANNSERLTVGLAVAMAILRAHNGGLLKKKKKRGEDGRGVGGGTDSARCDVEKAPLSPPPTCVRFSPLRWL